MFVAIHLRTNERFVSLDNKWRTQLDVLRELGRSGHLGCPECRQLVHVRNPRERRRHFFHKERASCPLHGESPEIVEARAVLYEWLATKFPGRVQIEHRPEESMGLPRPVDVLVTIDDGIRAAFWIFDAPLRDLELRGAIQDYFVRAETHVIWVFTSSMLRSDSGLVGGVQLTKMERDFIARTDCDELESSSLGSLHYLDATGRRMTTYRCLREIHAPNVHRGTARASDLEELLVRPRSCEIVHPGEHEALAAYRKAQEREEARARQAHEREQARVREAQERQQVRAREAHKRQQAQARETQGSKQTPARAAAAQLLAGSGAVPQSGRRKIVLDEPVSTIRCIRCGAMKTETECSMFKRMTGEGTCKSCMRRGG